MRKQACTLDRKLWNCWEAAVRNLQILADQGPATCEAVGEPDVYGRILARCTINGKSLNEQLVREGWAVARPSDTTDYVAAEAAAKKEKLGLWQGQFQPPDQFRSEPRHFRRSSMNSTAAATSGAATVSEHRRYGR